VARKSNAFEGPSRAEGHANLIDEMDASLF